MTWQVGDLAVCVDARMSPVLIDGGVYTVAAYFRNPAINSLGRFTEYTLRFHEMLPPRGCTGFCETRFRKILPDKHEQCEPEFVTLLKRSKVKETASDWLERAGPIAKQLNLDARKDQ